MVSRIEECFGAARQDLALIFRISVIAFVDVLEFWVWLESQAVVGTLNVG